MSASILRAAAALIRERAEAATPGPWFGSPHTAPADTQRVVWAGQATVAEVSMPIPAQYGLDGVADREHIASWHPDVALDAARLFDAAEKVGPAHGGILWDATVTLARTYLSGVTP